jgi:hypothetical protein
LVAMGTPNNHEVMIIVPVIIIVFKSRVRHRDVNATFSWFPSK